MEKITKRKDGSLHIETINEEPSLTQQHYKDSCDINNIVLRYAKTGEPIPALTGVYADLSDAPTYQEALAIIEQAQSAFGTLDAKVRSRFQNDPAQLLSFLGDNANREEAIQLGLITPPPPANDSTNASSQGAKPPTTPPASPS